MNCTRIVQDFSPAQRSDSVNSRRKKHAVFCVVFFMTMAGLLLIRCGLADQSEDRLRILICNDDGIEAPGIAALFEAVSQIAQVTVAAPPQNYSGAGHSMNFERPISVGNSRQKAQNGMRSTRPRRPASAWRFNPCFMKSRIWLSRESTREKIRESSLSIRQPWRAPGKPPLRGFRR